MADLFQSDVFQVGLFQMGTIQKVVDETVQISSVENRLFAVAKIGSTLAQLHN